MIKIFKKNIQNKKKIILKSKIGNINIFLIDKIFQISKNIEVNSSLIILAINCLIIRPIKRNRESFRRYWLKNISEMRQAENFQAAIIV